MLGEVGLGDQLASVQHQVFQHLVLVAGEVDDLAFHRHRLRGGVELDHAAGEDRFGPPTRTAHQRVDARQQFLDVERLDQIVVGAVFQALDLVLPAAASGKDQDRIALAVLAQRLDQIHAGHLGQAQIDDRQIERHFAAKVDALFAVLRRIDCKAITLEACRQSFA